MALVFREVHPSSDRKRLNEEFFLLENTGGAALTTAGLNVIVSRRGKRGSVLGSIDPGFTLQPGEKILMVSGMPGKKAHGEPPVRDGVRVYHLLQREPMLQGAGTTLRLALNQIDVAKVTYDPEAPGGVAGTSSDLPKEPA